MLKTPDVFLVLCLVGAANALYKQWIPDTNYENKTNWDKGFVPCGNDRVEFPAGRRVSVYVETTHSIQEMRLPVNGEFILNSGAGFYVGGGQEPGCGAGATTQFKDSESLQWFNPALWQAAVSLHDLENGQSLFSVHEESVPCQYDNVGFREGSSFRVDTNGNQPSISVQSVSVLGKTFTNRDQFSSYLGSRSGRLQFHGSSTVNVGGAGCNDPSGCDCGNSANRDRICVSVTCPSLTCKKPLRPVGHCCDVCGAILTVHYALGFKLEVYRQRLQQLFLIQPPYKSIQLGMSKVFKSQRFMGIVPRGVSVEIQVVLLDGETGSQSGTVAESLARVILKDAKSQGAHQGIIGAEFQASSGNSSVKTGSSTGLVVGTVFGVLILVTLIGVLVVLLRKGVVKMPKISMPSMPSMPAMPSLSSLKKNGDIGELGGPMDHGYDNPMFDKPTVMPDLPSLYGTGMNNSISLTQSGVHFVNPVYDENETDFNI